MKKWLIVSAVVLLLGAGTLAGAVGPGWGPGACNGPGYGSGYGPGSCEGGGGPCGGPGYGRMGYGRGMMGPGFMMGARDFDEDDQKFLDETAELRKQLHDKRFEYFEMARNPKADEEGLRTLEKEIDGLRDQIRDKSPQEEYRGPRGGRYRNQACGGGPCW